MRHLCWLPLLAAASGSGLTIARDGQSDCVIVVAADAPTPDRTAAEDLAAYLRRVTGAEIPIVNAPPAGLPCILVGDQPALRARLEPAELTGLGPDGILIRTAGDALLLVGTPPRGTLYAVNTFLEDTVGVRWWSSTEETVPARPTLEIGPLDVRYTPPLRVREAFYRDAQEGVFSTRLRLNGHFHRIPPERGGHYEILGWCHTFYQLLPPEKYFAEHPDWYSERGGRRVADGGQLCLANTEMLDELIHQALGWIQANPSAGMISISQNDWHGACECAECRAVVEAEGSQSGPLIRFVNQVAEAIEREYPDFLVETLAYQYTRAAPKLTRPRDNVVVRLCSIECSFSQPLTGPQNEAFLADIQSWRAVAPKLFVWDYVTNFSNFLLPHPNLQVLAPNVRTFVEHGTIGLFEQGDAYCDAGDFVRLRAWLLAHLQWDPSRDEQALIDEFLTGYYGAAAPPLRAYRETLQRAVEESGHALRCFGDSTSGWLDARAITQATQQYDQAVAAVAGDPLLAARVDRERLPLDLVWLLRGEDLRPAAAALGLPDAGPTDRRAAMDDFLARCERYGVQFHGEGRAFAPYADRLRGLVRDPAPPPTQAAGLPADGWLDVQDHRFSLHGYGNWVDLARDDTASDAWAARMPGGHPQWAVQLPIGGDSVAAGRYQVWVRARAESAATDGDGLSLGIYHNAAGALAQRAVPLAEVRGAYVDVDLGEHDLAAGSYVWVAPPNRPEVTAVWVDRVVLVRR